MKLTVLFVLIFAGVSFAQPQRKTASFPAIKFAEIGDMPRDSWEKELRRFADAGRAYEDSSLDLIVYAQTGAPRTSIDSIKKQYRDFLKQIVGDSIYVSVVSGGYRKQFATELWIVSKSDMASATPDERFAPEKLSEIEEASDEEFLKIFRSFIAPLLSEPENQVYIINYGADTEIARREKLITDSIAFRFFDRPRITLMRGGPRSVGLTSFWIVPPGADYPKP